MAPELTSKLKLDDLAVEVVLERRERSYSFGEPRVGSYATRDDKSAPTPTELENRIKNLDFLIADRKAIRSVIENFENLQPNDVLAAHGQITTDPYISIAEGEMTSVDQAVLTNWLNSNVFGEVSGEFGGALDFLSLNVVLIDESTATATYSIAQADLVGTSAVVLTKGSDGQWRIAVHCQHPITA
jgi:hypothetical protein